MNPEIQPLRPGATTTTTTTTTPIWKFNETGIPLFLYTKQKINSLKLKYSDYLADVVKLFNNDRTNFDKCCERIFNQMFCCIESNDEPDNIQKKLDYFYEDNIEISDYFDNDFIKSFSQDINKSMLIPYKYIDRSVNDKSAYDAIQPDLTKLKEIQKQFLSEGIQYIIMQSHNSPITDFMQADYEIVKKICRAFGIGYTKNSEGIEYFCSQNKDNKIIRYFMLRDIGSTTYKPYGVKKPEFYINDNTSDTDRESLTIIEESNEDGKLVSKYLFSCKKDSFLDNYEYDLNYFKEFKKFEKAGLFSGGSFIIPVINNGADKYFCLPYDLKDSDSTLSFDATFGGTQEHNTSSKQTFFNELFEESGYLSFLKKEFAESENPLYRSSSTSDNVKLRDIYSVFNTDLIEKTEDIQDFPVVSLNLDLVNPRGNLSQNDEIEIPKKSIGDTYIQFVLELNTNKDNFKKYLESEDNETDNIMPYLQYFDEVSPNGRNQAYSGFFLIEASKLKSFLDVYEDSKINESREKKEKKNKPEQEYHKDRVKFFKNLEIKKLVQFNNGAISGVFNDVKVEQVFGNLNKVVTFFTPSQCAKCIGKGESILSIKINGKKIELKDININYETNIKVKEFLPNDYLIMKKIDSTKAKQPRRPRPRPASEEPVSGGRKYKKSKKIKKRKTVKKKKTYKKKKTNKKKKIYKKKTYKKKKIN